MKAGWLSILKNSKQLLTNARSPNNINRIWAANQVHSNINKFSHRQHTECTPLRLRTDEEVLQDLLSCFNEFNSNPFDLSSPFLRTLELLRQYLMISRRRWWTGKQISMFFLAILFSQKQPQEQELFKHRVLRIIRCQRRIWKWSWSETKTKSLWTQQKIRRFFGLSDPPVKIMTAEKRQLSLNVNKQNQILLWWAFTMPLEKWGTIAQLSSILKTRFSYHRWKFVYQT